MNLSLPPNLKWPTWNKLDLKNTEKLGLKISRKIGHEMKLSVLSLKTYFNEILNPMVMRDFKEKTVLVFQDGKLREGELTNTKNILITI